MHPLLDRFEKNVAQRPERLAVGDISLALDYRQLRAIALGIARQIHAQSRSPHVAVLAPTSAACAAAILGCWYAGKTPVPLNFLLSPAELQQVLADAQPDLLIAVPHFAEQAQNLPLASIVLKGSSTLIPADGDAPPATPDDLAALIYTSGTSGAPKGVRLTFGNLVHNAEASIAHTRMTPDQVFLSALPQFHCFGFTTMTVIPLILGASARYLPKFSPVTILNEVQEHQASVFFAIPSMFAALAKMKDAPADAFRTFQIAVSGGEPLPTTVADAFEQRFGVPVMEGYGMTETSPVIAVNTADGCRARSVGRPLPGLEVYTVDEHGHRLPPGQEGEVVVRGASIMHGYHNQPEETAQTLKGDALHTGDLGHVDADGFLFITGRKKELIIVGGENVMPREIEAALAEHPAVAEAAVVGKPDDVRGEVPVAFVVLADGKQATENELRTHCRQKLAGYKVPRAVHFLDELPHTPTGKVLKRKLPL